MPARRSAGTRDLRPFIDLDAKESRSISPCFLPNARRQASGKSICSSFGVKIDKKVVDLVQHFLRAGIGAVNLVDDYDRRQVCFEGLAQYVAGLGSGPSLASTSSMTPLDHLERAFDFAAEVACGRAVHDVDFYVVIEIAVFLARMVMPRSAPVHFEIHDSFDVCSLERNVPLLLQDGVNQCGLAVVDVRDDSDIANA